MDQIETALGSAEAARFLGVTRQTMATWRSRGCGPPVHYSGTKPTYRLSELRAWQETCTAARSKARSNGATA